MARYHKNIGMVICTCKDADEQKQLCSYWDSASSYIDHPEYCEWWNRMEVIEVEYDGRVCRHCRNPDAQCDCYKTRSLQV